MLVGNHDGGYVFPDAICLGSFYYDGRGTGGRRLYAMMHDFPFRIAPTLTEWLQRCGVVPASRRNSEAILDAGHHILVYPGGSFEAFRRFSDRSTITLGHRTGFVRQSLLHRVPITPVVSVGAHETLFVLARGDNLAKKLGLSRFRVDVAPFWLGLPFGIGWGPIPNLPLPSKIKLEVLRAPPPVEGARQPRPRRPRRAPRAASTSSARACRTSPRASTANDATRSLGRR